MTKTNTQNVSLYLSALIRWTGIVNITNVYIRKNETEYLIDYFSSRKNETNTISRKGDNVGHLLATLKYTHFAWKYPL